MFLINLPVGAVALAAGLRVLPAERRREQGPEPDLLGALMLTAAIGLFALILVEGNAWGWSSPGIIASLAAAPILLALFLVRSARHRAPVVELPMLRLRPFSTATVATLLFAITFAWDAPFRLAVVPERLGVFRAQDRPRDGSGAADDPAHGGPGRAASAACRERRGGGTRQRAVRGRTAVLGAALGSNLGLLSRHAPRLPHRRCGCRLGLATLTAAGATALPIKRFATGTGILTMARQIGAVLGVAILVLVLGSPRTPFAAQNVFHHGWYEMAAAELVTAVACLAMPRSQGQRRQPSGLPGPGRSGRGREALSEKPHENARGTVTASHE